MILDAETLALTPGVEALVSWAEGRSLPGVLKMELLASMVELATGVCASAAEARESLLALRAAAAEAARENGLAIAAAGTHAFSTPTAQQIAPDPRYREFVEYAGISARRQAVCGLHVHVGMPGADECMAALEGVLAWLPVVLALSANSPFLAGEETGLASSRAEVLAQLPRARSAPTPSGRPSSSASYGSGSPTATRASGGTSARTRASGPSRSVSPTSRPRSS